MSLIQETTVSDDVGLPDTVVFRYTCGAQLLAVLAFFCPQWYVINARPGLDVPSC